LTGAGVSAESGLGTFRDTDGLWSKYDLEDVATSQGYARNPKLVLDFYNARRENLLSAKPNKAHTALARLAAKRDVTLITQNIDDLHERGGAADVIHMHGSLVESLCTSCSTVGAWRGDMTLNSRCDQCGDVSCIRPNVVWFGEMPYHMDRIEEVLPHAAQFVSIGTSGSVYPAAGYVAACKQFGIPTLELNLEPSDNAGLFDDGRYGPATEIVPAWVDEVLAQPAA